MERPHIVRLVADRARQVFYFQLRRSPEIPRPRILDDEIGVVLDDEEFIPYADLGYHREVGFFRLSNAPTVPNEAAPYAAYGQLINYGKVMVSSGVAGFLSTAEMRELLERHGSGDFGEAGEFYDADVTDDMLTEGTKIPDGRDLFNKVNALTGMSCVFSEYVVRGCRIWVITDAGPEPTTAMLLAGPAA